MLTRRLALLLGVAPAISGFVLPTWARTEVGRVIEGQGAAFAETRGSARPLTPQAQVLLDDLVRTGQDGRVAMMLGAKTTLRLGGDTRLKIDRFLVDQGGVITLASGIVRVDTQGALSRGLSVRSPYALVAVRGTGFIAGAEPGRGFSVLVDRGRVDVSAGGSRVSLRAGEGTTIAARGGRPSAPVAWSPERADRFRARVR